ncbi:glycoside hydrolase family 13 protein [Cylindrobasidium torrendii FP15055 ss-10]|uniref:Glycoside hydrolase family 13 protein n=1 Tax=Cylindrobasidium torrendii FP15055 ss-10 TaxID=1314674 RepID=A0A0D7BJE7_9AGAR|nr:glycoside hydrolase family 13 protein [Cylindrobasidium torrendii FP15055 ss-10]
MTTVSLPNEPWWKSSVVYQIYPISFLDTTGDGFGDLNGITSKLDYLKDLGVDVLWLCPIYKSPLADMGYDIADYRAIDERYGTLEDWDRLLKGVHERGMKLMMDLVANHTSDEHQWFVESRASKDSPKRDWYVWRPPRIDADGKRHPPNNWRSVFEGSAWTYDEPTGEYYLHLYLEKQPDLNWESDALRNAVWDLMRFWLDRGCDGFRMDVINLISKVEGLPNADVVEPKEEFQPAFAHYANGPRVHEFIKDMRRLVLDHYDTITVGETPFTYNVEELARYVLPANKELHMVFQFELMTIDQAKVPDASPLQHADWKVSELRDWLHRWQTFKKDEGFWNAVFIENHDHPRAVSRFGNDTTTELRTVSAKLISLFEITQKGTLYVYQGQELGIKNFPRSWGLEEYKDCASQNYWTRILHNRSLETGKKEEDIDMEDILDNFQKKARDHSRTPMQWDSSANSGFSTGTPWMRVNDDFKTWNAELQIKDEQSVHSFYKKALKTRKENPVLIFGEFELLLPDHPTVIAFKRIHGSQEALVLLNFRNEDASVALADEAKRSWRLLLGNYAVEEGQSFDLKPYEGRVYIL